MFCALRDQRYPAALTICAACLCLALWLATAAADPPNDRPAPALAYPNHHEPLLGYTPSGAPVRLTTPAQWHARRADILAQMQKVMGPLPPPQRRVPLAIEVLAEKQTPETIRRHLLFTPEPGDRVPAILFLPRANKTPRPAMLCLHQTTAVGKSEPAGLAGLPNLHYAAELAARGFVTLAVDYPNFGEYRFDPYAAGYASATMKGIWNHMRAVDLLCELPEVDPRRIGVIGHSLGGHNSLFVAAFDERLQAVVTCCGYCAFTHYYGGDVTGWSHRGYMPRIAQEYHARGREMPFDFPEVLSALAPRACLTVAPVDDANFEVSGVELCVQRAAGVYQLLGAGGRLAAIYPNAQHDFPPEARQAAYDWLEVQLQAPGDAQVPPGTAR